MRNVLTVMIGLMVLSGCKNIAGPCTAREKRKENLRCLPLEEQERRARDEYTIPSDDFRIGPATGIDRPSPTGR